MGSFPRNWIMSQSSPPPPLEANLNIVQIAPHLTKICSVYVKAGK